MHQKHESERIMSVVAVRRIERGDEIFIRYQTGTGDEAQPVWFEVR
jgi:hypothetical protein